jgi:hypothetical protein
MAESPFNAINAINYKTPVSERDMELYSNFMTNRFFSYFRETVLIANLGNTFSEMDRDIHFTFYNSIITKGKRFSKWYKSEDNKEIATIAEYYDISLIKAKQVIKLLSEEQKKVILAFMKEKKSE